MVADTVVSWIAHHARRTPSRTALVDLHRDRAVTYSELDARVRSLARSLAEAYGVGAGDRVAVLSRSDTRVFEVLYACAVLGAIAVPLNWRLTAPELAAISRDAEPSVLVHESWAAEVASGLEIPARVVWASADGEPDDYEALTTTDAPADREPGPVDVDAVWTILYTSGTTGRPKGVQATHRAWLASLLGILVAHRVDASSRCLTVLPTFHVAGLNLFAHPTLYVGGTVVVARTFDPARTLALLTDPATPVTHFCGVPAHYQFMEQVPGFSDVVLRPFTAVVGGSPVPSALVGGGRRVVSG